MHGMTESQWESVKSEMVPVMRRTATNEDTISYSDLMKQVRTIRIGPDDPAVASLLGQISEDAGAAGRGMLSVVVVHKTGDKMPVRAFSPWLKPWVGTQVTLWLVGCRN
jgi:hypothetical protein